MATRFTLAACIVLSCAASAAAEDSTLQLRTPNTLTAPADLPSPPATLQDMAWLAGKWTGTGLGGACEETWSAPEAGAMMGMFRFVKDGKIVFYEFLTLVEREGSLLLKLKHFNPDLTAWEEKADFVSFRLLKVAPDAMHFAGLTFKRIDANSVEIFLAIRDRATGSVREEKFVMSRP